MKKTMALVMTAAISLLSFAGCASSSAGVKTGLGVTSTLADSKEVADGKGTAVGGVTAAAVTVDKDGKIVKCVIDGVRADIEFSDKGELLTPADTQFPSKNELKEEYGMKSQSGIGKEWYEQAAAFADYVEGKTVDEVKGIALDAEGKASDTELTASVTVHVGDFISAVEKAVANAKDAGAASDDKLGLSIVSSAEQSASVGEKDGVAMVYSYFTATTFGKDNKVTSSVIDAAQNKLTFDATGKITSDINAEQSTKNEKGDAYGMKSQSGIGKEWYEQAASFADYVKGKTVDEVKGIALNDEGVATDKELVSSVTIHVTAFIDLIEKAAASAK